MHAWTRWWWIGVLIAALAIGCGDSDGGSDNSAGTGGGSGAGGGSGTSAAGSAGGGTTDGPTLDEVGDMFATAFCDVFAECLPAPVAEQYFGPDGCLARFGPTLDDSVLQGLQAAIDAGRVTYDASKVDDCFTAINALPCDDGVRVFEHQDCADVFVGSIAEGGGCLIDEECIGTAFCDRTTGCPGTCTAPIAAGGACEDDDHCESGLTCGDESNVCEAQAANGEACGGGVAPDCNLGLVCGGDDDETMTAGSCKPNAEVFVGSVGDVCDFDTSLLCSGDLSCAVTELTMDGATFECVTEVASGAACNFSSPDMCPSGEFCDGLDLESGDVDGTCAAMPQRGEPCIESFAGPCSPGLICADDGTCQAFGRIGDSCVGDETCASDNCADGTCAEPETCAL